MILLKLYKDMVMFDLSRSRTVLSYCAIYVREHFELDQVCSYTRNTRERNLLGDHSSALYVSCGFASRLKAFNIFKHWRGKRGGRRNKAKQQTRRIPFVLQGEQ